MAIHPRVRLRPLVILIALVTISCGSNATDPGAQTTSEEPSGAIFPAIDGPLIRYPERDASVDGVDAEIFGILEVEGDCLYLTDDVGGERFPVIWPAGTRWMQDRQSVDLPNGEQLELSDVVYGSGGYGDTSSVGRIAGAEAAALASRCVDNEFGEVAIVNNFDNAIGRADS